MYKITNKVPLAPGRWARGGKWYVLPGSNYLPTRFDNPNLFFSTLAAAEKAVRRLNK